MDYSKINHLIDSVEQIDLDAITFWISTGVMAPSGPIPPDLGGIKNISPAPVSPHP